jgi:hypothetical protein
MNYQKTPYKSIILFWFCFNISFFGLAQEFSNDSTCIEKDLPELIRSALGKDPKLKETGASSLLIVPII